MFLKFMCLDKPLAEVHQSFTNFKYNCSPSHISAKLKKQVKYIARLSGGHTVCSLKTQLEKQNVIF